MFEICISVFTIVSAEYPFVNKRKRYPIGHPKIITAAFGPIEQYFGIARVDVLPPKSLFMPALPHRSNGKLLFALCRTCSAEQCPVACTHLDCERILTGTWCTPELVKAVELGYKIVRIHEVWHFEDSQVGLFADYINKFLKIKAEASGFPAENMSEDEVAAFIDDFRRAEGIELERGKIALNPGLRALAKLCLNSEKNYSSIIVLLYNSTFLPGFWGRFGMRNNKSKTEFVTTVARFHELLLSGRYIVTEFELFSEDVVMVHHRNEEVFDDINPTTNVVLAA